MSRSAAILLLTLGSTSAFVLAPRSFGVTSKLFSAETEDAIVSPFDESNDDSDYTPTEAVEAEEGPLDLTWDNVEMVLDEMRPYLIQDGGNVIIAEIDGPVVRLQLQVNCSFC
jgi:lysyl-tRNA synthetase class 2